MKYLFVVDTFYGGGAGRVTAELANAFFSTSDVSVCTFGEYKSNYELNKDINHIDGSKASRVCGNLFCGRVLFLREIVREKRPDVVISFLTELNLVTILACSKMQCKIVVSERNDPSKTRKSLSLARKLLYPRADKIVFQTQSIRDYFKGPISKKGIVIANPINPNLPDVYKGKREKKIVMVGRLNKQKNYTLAFDAFASIVDKIPGYELYVYGDGNSKQELQNYIIQIKMIKKIHLKGHISNLFNEIRKAAVYVMSSDYEGMPNALMEAMALGIPTISTDHGGGGARTLISSYNNGILIPIRDKEALAKAILLVINNQDLSEKISYNGQKVRLDYSIENIVEKWQNLILSLWR